MSIHTGDFTSWADAALAFALGVLSHKLYLNRAQQRRRALEATQRKLDDAQLAADALRGHTCVDGIELPLPSAAWEFKEITFTGGTERCLSLGPMAIGPRNGVYAGDGPPMAKTAATEAYANAVWRAYRKRCAREAIEKAGA